MYGTSEKVALLRWLLCLLITGGACAMSCQDESTDVFLGILQAQCTSLGCRNSMAWNESTDNQFMTYD